MLYICIKGEKYFFVLIVLILLFENKYVLRIYVGWKYLIYLVVGILYVKYYVFDFCILI